MTKKILNLLTTKGKIAMVIGTLFFSFYALFGSAIMLVTLKLFSQIFTQKGSDLTNYWLLLLMLLVLKGISNAIGDYAKHLAGFDIVYQLRKKIILQLKYFSLSFYTNERLGKINTVIHRDVDNMEHVVGHLWTRMGADFIVAILLFLYLAFNDTTLAFFMILLLPFALYLLYKSIDKTSKLEISNSNNLVNLVSIFIEYVKGIPIIKAFSQSESFKKEVQTKSKTLEKSSNELTCIKAKSLSKFTFLVDLSFLFVAIFGIVLLYNEMISLEIYLVFIILSKDFLKPFYAMQRYYDDYIKISDSYKRVEEIINANTVKEPKNPKKLSDKFDISFENVSFLYEENSFKMQNISFNIPQNSICAIVGKSGAGKTSIVNLLLRFWDVNSGAIKIGNTNIKDLAYDDLLSNISIVMQNVKLFNDTIFNNIAFGKKNATLDEVIEVAKKARIDDFIQGLENGYNTQIGENGTSLSGGQKQRISIARAFLKNTPILILDEMSSNIDPINEVLIQEAVTDLAKNRTVIVIAHNLNTIKNVDKIIVLEKGKIAQIGNHDDLIKQSEGVYLKLWNG